MSNYIICTDSTSDLPADYRKKYNLVTVPLSYTLEGKNYPDDESSSFSQHEFYESMRKGAMPVTSQVNAEDFIDHIEPLIKNGNDVLFIAFSSGLSGTYQSCTIGAAELMEKYPERKIIVIDSLCASLGEGLLVHYALKNQENGLDIHQNAEWIETNKLKICHWFTVDSLDHLHRMGRVSKAVAFVGGLLGIKPVLHMANDGKLHMVTKVRGRTVSFDKIVEKMAETAVHPENQDIFISHGDCLDDAELLADKVEARFGKRPCLINYVGAVIGSHSGPGTLALFFIGTER